MYLIFLQVAGNFHFAPGKSFQQSHVHGKDLHLVIKYESNTSQSFKVWCRGMFNSFSLLTYFKTGCQNLLCSIKNWLSFILLSTLNGFWIKPMSQYASDLKVLPACSQMLHVASHFLLRKGVHGEPLRSAFVFM